METILIADDHELIRWSIRTIIEGFSRKYKIIEASTCTKVRHLLSREKVRYAIMEIQLADGNIFFTSESILAYSSRINILVYSASAEMMYARRLLQKGVRGFLCKQASVAELEAAIRTVLHNDLYLSASQKEIFLKDSPVMDSQNPLEALSDREMAVAEGLIAGIGTTALARRMDLDKSTVSTYRNRLFRKLEVKNVMELKDKFFWYRMQV